MLTSSKNWILYADDDADDRLLLSESFSAVVPEMPLVTVKDGQAAIDYLEQNTPPYPCLLILDLNMPGLSGWEVAEKVRQHPQYGKIPMVIFTTSSNPADRHALAQLGIDMITKPVDLDEYEHAASKLAAYCGAA